MNHTIGFDLLHFYGPHSLLEYPEVFLFMIPFLKMKWRFFKNNIFVKMKSLILGFSNPANKHKTFFLFSLHMRACINSFIFLSWYTINVTKNTINFSSNKSIGKHIDGFTKQIIALQSQQLEHLESNQFALIKFWNEVKRMSLSNLVSY